MRTSGCDRQTLSRKLACVEKGLTSTYKEITTPESHEDSSLLEQHQEQLLDYKKDLTVIYEDIVAFDMEDE